MREIVQIKIITKELDTEEIRKNLTDRFLMFVEKFIELEIWDDRINKIIITDNFIDEIQRQASEWDIKTFISKEKEYSVVSKVLFNYQIANPEYIIFFDLNNFLFFDASHINIIFSQILNIYCEKIFPDEINQYKFKRPKSLDDYIKVVSREWCKSLYKKAYLNKIFPDSLSLINNNSLLIAFKRKLKKNLYDYNSDRLDAQSRLDAFWDNYIESLNTLFIRLVENKTEDVKLQIKQGEPCIDLIDNILFELEKLTQNCLENKPYDIHFLKQAVVDFSAHFDVILKNESDTNFEISLTKNPKDYFTDEIIETEPRIICFMDILGFSELINEYDSDITSTLLQDIQESFALAKNSLVRNNIENISQTNEDVIKHLKYQTFSDNICISIPFFDNENDFLMNFSLLSTYVRSFQMIMMGKGIFMRGGISMGSYYADNNIIFSKGLVNAYNIESKKAIYPRVVIDNSIIEKIFSYNKSQIKYFGIDGILIFDWENCAFLNPFGLIETSIQQFESMFDGLNPEDVDESISTLLDSFKENLKEVIIGSLNDVSQEETKELESIKNKILNCLIKYNHNDHISSKYLWLLEFIKWFEKDLTGNLKFEYFKDRINKLSLS